MPIIYKLLITSFNKTQNISKIIKRNTLASKEKVI